MFKTLPIIWDLW